MSWDLGSILSITITIYVPCRKIGKLNYYLQDSRTFLKNTARYQEILKNTARYQDILKNTAKIPGHS
jgi:hypothetical protein